MKPIWRPAWPAARRRREALVRWLDEVHQAWLWAAGIVLGMAVGAGALLGVGGWAGLLLCLLALGLATAAGWDQPPRLLGAPPPPAPPPAPPLPIPPPDWPPLAPRVVVDLPGRLEMVELPGGTFAMGSPESDDQAYEDEKPRHWVRLSAFAIARHPVTRELYREVMRRAPDEWQGDERLPANYLSWFDALDFCNELSRRQGLRPCYRRAGETVEWDRDSDAYRLPTEAEWEYAARAGTTTRWFFGDAEAELDRHAWFAGNSDGRPHPVGEKAPNPWGLHDMIGNTWEWCWDSKGEYSAAAALDPSGPPDGSLRVLRGGAVWNEPRDLRSAYRSGVRPEYRYDFIGFRCVRGPRRQPP